MKWPQVTIEEIRATTRYSLVGGPFGSDLTTRDYVEEGVPVIRGANLPDDCSFKDDDFVFVRDEKADALKANNAHPGDVVFTQRGTLGQVGLIPTEPKFPRYLVSQSQMKLTVDPAKADARFVFYFFRHPRTVQSIKNRAITSGVPHINLGILRDFKLPLPPLNTQREIVATLSAYDELMENNRRRMELLEESAGLLYREWFVRLRFPGHEHARLTNSLPAGWERKCLAEIAEVNRATLSNGFDGVIEYVDIASVVPRQITETTTYDFRDAPSRARRVVQHGDIIWSCVRPNRRSHAVIWNPQDNLIVSTGFAVITPTAAPSAFIYFATTTDAFAGYLENRARGAAYPAVVAADFEQAEILVPSKRLLELFDEIVEPMFSQAHNLRQQNQKLRAARDLLLPRLMSGEIAV
jgi:type I restriction enzyme S subunit